MTYSYRVILKLSWYSKRLHFTNEIIFFNRYFVNLNFLKILDIIDMQNKQKIFWSKYTQHIPYTECQLCTTNVSVLLVLTHAYNKNRPNIIKLKKNQQHNNHPSIKINVFHFFISSCINIIEYQTVTCIKIYCWKFW